MAQSRIPKDMLVAAARKGLVSPKLSLIARLAGVSTTTVNNVLQGKPASEGTKQQVLRVIGLEEVPKGGEQ